MLKYIINPCCKVYRSASYTDKTMSEYSLVVINWVVSS